MERYLIGAAALLGLTVAVIGARRLVKNRKARQEERYFAGLRQTLGIKPGAQAGGEKGADAKVVLAPPAVAAVAKGPGTALMLHPDANGLRVNGKWLTTMNYTVEPDPIHATRYQVGAALERARRHNSACNEARKQHRWDEAQGHLDKAMAEVESVLRRDHWFTAEVLNQLGCLTYERGNYVEARSIWCQAELICEEWPNFCKNILPTIQKNLERVKSELGF